MFSGKFDKERFLPASTLFPSEQVFAAGLAHHQSGRLADAERAYRAVLADNPAHVQALHLRGVVLHQVGRQDLGLPWMRRSLGILPGEGFFWSNLADGLRAHNRINEALPALKRALILAPGQANANHNLALSLLHMGDREQARHLLDRAIRIEPRSALFHYTLATEVRVTDRQDARLAAMEELARQLPETSVKDLSDLQFALGVSYKDLGDADRAVKHFITANRLKRTMLGYDESGALALFDGIEQAFPGERFSDLPPVERNASGPILVVGMPRSGTSLVEQILASHSAVFGAGELTLLEQTLLEMFPRRGGQPAALAGLPSAELRRAGDTYRAGLRALAGPGPSRIVDKLPLNFFHCGLIAMMLPDARIVHVRRDPVDTCLSCFSTHFAGGHAYALDLADLGRFYRRYQDLMAHWRRVLPAGAMVEVTYEKIVADLEGEMRPVFEHCGLGWEVGCLDFHRTRRAVVTASQSQVRRPLYKSSTSSWRPGKALLKPLLDALGD